MIAKLSAAIAGLHTEPPPEDVLPSEIALTHAREKLIQHLPTKGVGLEDTIKHLKEDIVPGFNASSRSSNYYGFVTGGTTPAASLADNLVTAWDQNVGVHLPKETIATEVEDKALSLLCELLNLDPAQWPYRTFTTGATASNILGLACGREYIIAEAAAIRSSSAASVGHLGIYEALHRAGLDKIQVLTTVPHSSLSKAASLIGMGRASVKTIALKDSPLKFDIPRLENMLKEAGTASVVAISAAEVNTGLFATSGLNQMKEIRRICDMYGAWIHVDGAFGIMGRMLTSPSYQTIINGCAGLDLADSITGDGHKLLNVPYDCGFFLSRHRDIAFHVFQNPNAAYLSSGLSTDTIMSPLNIGIENSRRLRALPVYASLMAYGKDGYREMLERQVQLARAIAEFIIESDDFELLPIFAGEKDEVLGNVYMIVLFRANDEGLNKELVDRIKTTRKIYVSGTAWEGKPACRFAVSNWMANVEKDLPVIKEALRGVVDKYKAQK
ncbi:pyridoxal-dependent decarboxylase [Lindgomyces ingoldianus]|uniref:Pyridoxal-dependent decarboxylase n=1 Tax=Lindgomyces ingoldianus TaxID=673940 RepID=A0ACB6QW83_9PLEO|nr:pyridoxal-dependent decarboxylase [Lindgomyces ingoldianus]KAF2470451.1 pyridoxal-dependent decarboxylase [Lindgomyces ingoldianus]